MSTKVIFRKSKEYGEIFAILPEIPADLEGNVQTYEHIGQHHAVDYHIAIQSSVPATEEEYIPLLCELQRIGYDNLEIYKRRTPQMSMCSA